MLTFEFQKSVDMKIKNNEDNKPEDAIYIIGNGVIAKALAVALSLNGRNVTILRGSVDDQKVSQEFIQVEIQDKIFEADIKVSSLSNYKSLDGIVLLTNKSFGNPALANKLRDKAGGCPIVFLQNGLHVENSFIEAGFSDLYRCVLLATSEATGENKVRFKLVAPSPIGLINGSENILKYIVEQLNTHYFTFREEPDIQTLIWKKVISNCVFNSICPLLEIDNGVFHRNESALETAKTVIRECLSVAIHLGIKLTEDDVLQNVLTISKSSDGQKISTYQDILNKRQTEIESFNFAIAHAAMHAGNIPVPVTSLLGELIKMKSELSRYTSAQ